MGEKFDEEKGKKQIKKKKKNEKFRYEVEVRVCVTRAGGRGGGGKEEEEEFFAEVCSTTHVTPLNTDYDASRTEMMKELHAGLDNI